MPGRKRERSRAPAGFEIVEEIAAYQGVRYAMHLVRERLPNGEIAERDVVRHPGASVVLPLVDDSHIVLVEQHRTALGRTLLEIPAGVLEAGEDPRSAAARELEEETGYRADSIEPLLDFIPTPGFCDERMHLFLATGLVPTSQNLDADEFIEVHIRSIDEVRRLIRDGEIVDGKTLAAILYLFAFRSSGIAGSAGKTSPRSAPAPRKTSKDDGER